MTYCQLRTGRLPFEGNAASVTAGHLFGRPDLDGLPEAERPILERALAKAPADRWPDCRAFTEALRAIPPDQVPDELIAPDDSSTSPGNSAPRPGPGPSRLARERPGTLTAAGPGRPAGRDALRPTEPRSRPGPGLELLRT